MAWVGATVTNRRNETVFEEAQTVCGSGTCLDKLVFQVQDNGQGAGAPPDRLDAEVERLVAAIAAKPRVALALGKALFYRQLETGIEAAYQDAGRTMACNMMDESALEGVQAFIEKRKPDWR